MTNTTNRCQQRFSKRWLGGGFKTKDSLSWCVN